MGEAVKVSDGFVDLELPSRSTYDISLEVIQSEADLLTWVYHLTEKSWTSTGMLREFIRKVSGVKGYRVNIR